MITCYRADSVVETIGQNERLAAGRVASQCPGIDWLRASFDAALGILNTETVGLAKQGFMMWGNHVNAQRGPELPRVTVDFAVLTFNQIENHATRDVFNAMPTTFRLAPEQVDALIAQSKALLAQSIEFQRFLNRLDEVLPVNPTPVSAQLRQ